MGMGKSVRNLIAKRAAEEIKDGMIVNLGIGVPTLVSNHIPADRQVMFHAENGVLGSGPSPQEGEEDANLCDAGGFPITIVDGASYLDSTEAFGIIRKGLLDITVLGALEVSETGDLANWIIPGKLVPGMGGAIELAQKSKKVIAVTTHVNKHGESKILKECRLPLTAKRCVDLIITDMAVMEVTNEGLLLKEVIPPYTVEDVQKSTEAKLMIPETIKTLI